MGNDDFTMKIPFLRMNGAGSLDIFNSARDYRLNAQVVSVPEFDDGQVRDDLVGLVLPIIVTGPVDAPDISVDVAAVAASIATKKLRERLLEKFGGNGEERENSGEDAATAEESPRDLLKKRLCKLFD